MNKRLNILVAAAALLLLANIVKWAGILPAGNAADSAAYDTGKLTVNYQEPGKPGHVKTIKGLFNPPVYENYSGYPGAQDNKPAEAAAVAAKKENENIWPQFKITGMAENDGKKCAFLSGAGFNGAVNEGENINDEFRLSAILENKVEIINNKTNETKAFNLEGK